MVAHAEQVEVAFGFVKQARSIETRTQLLRPPALIRGEGLLDRLTQAGKTLRREPDPHEVGCGKGPLRLLLQADHMKDAALPLPRESKPGETPLELVRRRRRTIEPGIAPSELDPVIMLKA